MKSGSITSRYHSTLQGTVIDVTTGHEYPAKYYPDIADAEIQEAWNLLDQIKPGEISFSNRSFLAGLIAAALANTKASRAPVK